ncbi:MAG: DUF58 domain-containing protein [Bdellovibrionaceae bacterium]|nr:DUF58 domain-containing protein [Pseudobdellovibrionaceae bacterium]
MAGGLPPEIAKKVKLLEISTRKLVNSLFAGQYHSAFRGQGMTFAEFREYVPGDDVRTISWPVTARTGKTFIKKFDEERELTLMLAVDVSGSLDFGSRDNFKGEIVAHLSALLGFSAAKNNDYVGLLMFSDQVEHFVPPKKGRGHIQRILRDLYYHRPKSSGTRIGPALDFMQGFLKKRANIFVFSDFQDETPFSTSLRMLSRKHDTIACVVQDPAELRLPDLGLVDMQDPESGEVITVDTSSGRFRRAYEEHMKRVKIERDRELRKSGVDRIDVMTEGDFVQPLISYFRAKTGAKGGR